MLLQIDSKQEVKWATVLFTPDIDDILYCSEYVNLNKTPVIKDMICYSNLLKIFNFCHDHASQHLFPV